jgi:hypothetical protein
VKRERIPEGLCATGAETSSPPQRHGQTGVEAR